MRFGGTFNAEEAWALGFHHIAIAAGAGKPTIIDVKNNLIPGVRKASDFLMALQLTGGFKEDTLANLQVRLPALVVGGGLTGIDTTTELAAYYPLQVEKFLRRWEALAAELGEDSLWRMYSGLGGGDRARVPAPRPGGTRRAGAGRPRLTRGLTFARLCASGAASSLVYRRTLQDSPAYRLNHEEVAKFLEEGVSFIENLVPRECEPDERGALQSVTLRAGARDGGTAAAHGPDGPAAGSYPAGGRGDIPERDLRTRASRYLRD